MTHLDAAPLLRPARAGDAASIAAVWHGAWHDGHDGHVPEDLVRARGPATFLDRAAVRVPHTIVSVSAGQVTGFVTVSGDELEQLFVAAAARGTGIAAALLAVGEGRLAGAGHREVWLAAVTGNARARHFYTSQGWRDTGPFDYATTAATGTVIVPCHRYTKTLAASSARGGVEPGPATADALDAQRPFRTLPGPVVPEGFAGPGDG